MSSFEEVRDLVGDALQLGDLPAQWTRETPLVGEIPELDSYAVVHVLTVIGEHFDIEFDDDELGGALESLGSLVELVDAKLA